MLDQSLAKDILSHKKLFVFDLDGTVYLGSKVFPFAITFINHLRKHGYRVLFFTNNASKSHATYMEDLTRRGFSPKPEEILTSGNVTRAYLTSHCEGQSVYVMGTEDLRREFREAGIHVVDESAEHADVAVASFDLTLTYERIFTICKHVRNGATYLATHPDPNCPSDRGPLPDCGAFIAMIEASTGRLPIIFGKPEAAAADMLCEVTHTPKDDICCFGDRLMTDIALGSHNGITSVLVETGANSRADAEALNEYDQPKFIFPSLEEVDRLLFPEKF